MKAHEILQAAAGHLKDRAATYDKPEGERSIAATVAAFNAVTGDGRMDTEERGWLFMALLKAVRSQQGAFRADNYEDGAAYFALAGESAAKCSELPAQCSEVKQECSEVAASKPRPDWSKAPEWANYVAQDSNGIWFWFENKPVEATENFVIGSIGGKYKLAIDGDANQNWYETLEQRPSTDDDWIPWHGGDTPVSANTSVIVKAKRMPVGKEFYGPGSAGEFYWGSDVGDVAIIAYKVVK